MHGKLRFSLAPDDGDMTAAGFVVHNSQPRFVSQRLSSLAFMGTT
jgi:hypothetical protein